MAKKYSYTIIFGVIVLAVFASVFLFSKGTFFSQVTQGKNCGLSVDINDVATITCTEFGGGNTYGPSGVSVSLIGADTLAGLVKQLIARDYDSRSDISVASRPGFYLADASATGFLDSEGIAYSVSDCASGDAANANLQCVLGLQRTWECGDPSGYSRWAQAKQNCYTLGEKYCGGGNSGCWAMVNVVKPADQCGAPQFTQCRYVSGNRFEEKETARLMVANINGSCHAVTSNGSTDAALLGSFPSPECAVKIMSSDEHLVSVEYRYGVPLVVQKELPGSNNTSHILSGMAILPNVGTTASGAVSTVSSSIIWLVVIVLALVIAIFVLWRFNAKKKKGR